MGRTKQSTKTKSPVAEEEISPAQPAIEVEDPIEEFSEDEKMSDAGSAAAAAPKLAAYVTQLRKLDIDQVRARLPKNPEDPEAKIRLSTQFVIELPKLKTGKIQDSKTAEWAKKKREEGEKVAESLKINIYTQPEHGPKFSLETLKKLRQLGGVFEKFFDDHFGSYDFISPIKDVPEIGEAIQVNLKKGKYDHPVYRNGDKKDIVISKVPQEVGYISGAFFINIYKMEVDGKEICGWTIKPADVTFYGRDVQALELKVSEDSKKAY